MIFIAMWIKTVTDKIIKNRIEKLALFYYLEIRAFYEIFWQIIFFWEDLNKRKDRKFNKAIKITLTILKLLSNSQKKNKVTNDDLIFIRWTAEHFKFWLNKNLYNNIKKKYPTIKNVPDDYTIALNSDWLPQDNDNKIENYLSIERPDFPGYIEWIPHETYYKNLWLLLIELDKGKWTDITKNLIESWIKAFLRDIKINHNQITHSFSKMIYADSDDSFEAVFFSEQGKESYAETWNIFQKLNLKGMNDKFDLIIHWEWYEDRQKKKEKKKKNKKSIKK